MSILNKILRKKPKYSIKLIGADSYISEKNKGLTSDSIMTNSIYDAKDFGNWFDVQDVLNTIDVYRERYIVVYHGAK